MLNRTLDYDAPRTRNERPQAATPSSFGLEDVQAYIAPVEELILKYPGPALASAFLVGVLVAWWIKRR